MSQSPELSNPRLDHILHVLVEHRKLWLLPGLAALAMSWVYVYFIRSDTYTARQTLIVRDDLLGQSLKPGQFESLDLMKSAQETILEISRKPQVIRNALKKIGPSSTSWFGTNENWPSEETIEDVQSAISLSAPNGAEFGHTETVVLTTKSNSRERAAKFVLALLEEIDTKINEVRDLRLRSMKNELTVIRDSAHASLQASAEKLKQMEREFGRDLPIVRALSDPQSGGGTLDQTLLQLRSERRQFENRLHSARKQRETLVAATLNPDAILATSDELFNFQPALSRLKQELIEAQSARAASIGRYEQAHPVVQKHEEQVRTMHRQIREELEPAKRGLNTQIASLEEKVVKSRAEEAEIESRFSAISSKRVDYLRLEQEVKKKSEVFNEAQGNLASIQRLDSSDVNVNLLTPVDAPQVSTRADGLGKTTTILGGGLAGFLAGFGLVLLLAPGPDQDLTPQETPSTPPPVDPRTSAPTAFPVDHQPTNQPPVPLAPSTISPPSTPATPTASRAEISKPNATPVTSQPVTKTEWESATKKAVPAASLAPTPRLKPEPASQQPPTQASKATAKPIRLNQDSRLSDIQAEIDQAVATSAANDANLPAQAGSAKKSPPTPMPGSTSASKKPVKAVTPSQVEIIERALGTDPSAPVVEVKGSQESAPQTDHVASVPQAEVAEPEQSIKAERNQANSTGVPTAASILAGLDNLSVDSKPGPIIKSQEAQNKTTAQLPTTESVHIKPSPTPDDTSDRELELRRRLSQRPLDIAKQGDPVSESQSTKPQVVLPTVSKPTNPKPTNPFLQDQPDSEYPPSTTEKHMATKSETEADGQEMVTPVSPVTQNQATDSDDRMPPATVPIPDQIKQLTDSIASFAKPIKRVTEPNKTEEF